MYLITIRDNTILSNKRVFSYENTYHVCIELS